MISLLFIVFAVFFNAIMDAVENENFFESIFSDNDKKFWYKRESWRSSVKVFGYRIDVWHLAKSKMIVCLFLAVISYSPMITPMLDFIIYGAVWNILFWFFYHKLFGVN